MISNYKTSGGFGDGTSESRCRNCGQPGHFRRECPHNRNEVTNSSTVRLNSGPGSTSEIQSMAAASVASETRVRQPVTYTPAEAQLDQLWNQHIGPGANFDRFFNIEPQISGDNTSCQPLQSFEDAGLPPLLMENVRKAGYDKPTPIQQYAIPFIAAGRDVMGCAQTGSGKTAAYLLPLLSSILKKGAATTVCSYHQEPVALIVTPTRELAVQIKDEARKFAAGTTVAVVVIYGGTNVQSQQEKLQRGCNVLVATPGRLMQFVTEARVGLSRCRYLVLDEADRMLDMGFEPTIRQLINLPEMPPKGNLRQTLMFSATFPPEIQQLAAAFLHQYVFVTIGKVGGANEDIVQEILIIPKSDKFDKLNALITEDLERNVSAGNENVTKTLIFVERKRTADFIASRLSQMGLPTTSIHGDREQREREEALHDFKTGRCPVLVATAVAARGLDIIGVDHVINFDLPLTVDEYVHRIGRTGRVGNPGRATSFYDSQNDKNIAGSLINVLKDAQQPVPDWLLAEYCSTGGTEAGLAGGGNNAEGW